MDGSSLTCVDVSIQLVKSVSLTYAASKSVSKAFPHPYIHFDGSWGILIACAVSRQSFVSQSFIGSVAKANL